MSDRPDKPAPCYRNDGAYFVRGEHRPDCNHECRGCRKCQGDHCTGRKSCTWHVETGQLTCGRCINAARSDLRWIENLAALMMTAAIGEGVNSEAANLAGPSVDPEAWSWRKAAARSGGTWHASLVEDDDEHHPHRVLATWTHMLTEDYGHDMPPAASLTWCAAYLDRTLHRLAHDDAQDFPLLARELRNCRQHLEAVLHNDDRPDRGVPCPRCVDEGTANPKHVRLRREYGHYCANEECTRINHADDTADVWRCPKVREHWWSHADYDARLEERKAG